MRFVVPVFAKLNLTLRVTGRREDGYHNLVSAFLRIPSGETLLIEPLASDAAEPPRGTSDPVADQVEVHGLDLRLEGENIVSRALRLAREAGVDVPPLRVGIFKALWPGSGLGSGSGNAAALLQWLAPRHADVPRGTWRDVALRVGADVPFLFSGLRAAQVTGIGEEIEPLPVTDRSPLLGVVAFPDWEVGTRNAYAALDARYPDGYPQGEEGARVELRDNYFSLMERKHAGLLPNDFMPSLVGEHPRYEELFTLFEAAGALAWGVTGSGGAAFALFARGPGSIPWPEWVRQVLSLPAIP